MGKEIFGLRSARGGRVDVLQEFIEQNICV